MVKGIGERGGWRGIGDMIHLGEKEIVGLFLFYIICYVLFDFDLLGYCGV